MKKGILKSFIALISVFGALFYLSGFSPYKAEPLLYFGSMVEPFAKQGVKVDAKLYNSHDSRTYLSNDLNARGYQPIQVTIQNNSKQTFYLSTAGVDLNSVKTGKVAAKMMHGSIPRSIAFKIAGFFFWPMIIPGAIDSIITFASFRSFKAELHAKSIKPEGEEILPYSTVHRIVVVPHWEDAEEFTLHLKDAKRPYVYPYRITINS